MFGVAAAHFGADLLIRAGPEGLQIVRDRQGPPRGRQQMELHGHSTLHQPWRVRPAKTFLQFDGHHGRLWGFVQ